jgi:ubiquinone/menaquinone biosynthesis C-methylase UbiE
MLNGSIVFDQNAQEYDNWFKRHKVLYQSELLAVQQAIPKNKTGIEIGVGTGRFASPLNIKYGAEPSENMALISENRGIKVYRAFAEDLPVDNESFDFVLMVTTVCFLSDIPKAFSECYRILKPQGEIILAIIDKESTLGKKYEMEKATNKFYQNANFYSTQEITELLKDAGFQNFEYRQTLKNNDLTDTEQPVPGFGTGSFVVIKAHKFKN